MINNVNAVNSDYINTVETSQTQSTVLEKDENVSLEDKVYEQANVEDTVEISKKGKGLSDAQIRSMQDAMSQNKAALLKSFVNSSNSAYQTGSKIGFSVEEAATLIDSYNASRYLFKNAYKMYSSKTSVSDDELDELNDLKNQIKELESQIGAIEKEDK